MSNQSTQRTLTDDDMDLLLNGFSKLLNNMQNVNVTPSANVPVQVYPQPVTNVYQQQPRSAVPFGGMTLEEVSGLPEPVRAAIFSNAMQSQTSQLDQINTRLQGLEQAYTMQMYESQRHHSTKHKVMKYGGIALGVGAVAYGVHKYKHRHDKDRIETLVTSTTKAYIDAKYDAEGI